LRLRSDIWVSAYMRRCLVSGRFAGLRRRGAAEAGAIFVKIDLLDGHVVLYGPAPQSEIGDAGIERRWQKLHQSAAIEESEAEDRLRRELSFDPDLWIVEVESPDGEHFLDLV